MGGDFKIGTTIFAFKWCHLLWRGTSNVHFQLSFSFLFLGYMLTCIMTLELLV
jgi:hypothetical protein